MGGLWLLCVEYGASVAMLNFIFEVNP